MSLCCPSPGTSPVAWHNSCFSSIHPRHFERYAYCAMSCIITRHKTTRVCHCWMKTVRRKRCLIAKVFDYNFFPESSLNQGVWQQAAEVFLASAVKLVLHSSLTWKLSPPLRGHNSFTTRLSLFFMACLTISCLYIDLLRLHVPFWGVDRQLAQSFQFSRFKTLTLFY